MGHPVGSWFSIFWLLGCDESSAINQGYSDSITKTEPLTTNNEAAISNLANTIKEILEQQKTDFEFSSRRRGCLLDF